MRILQVLLLDVIMECLHVIVPMLLLVALPLIHSLAYTGGVNSFDQKAYAQSWEKYEANRWHSFYNWRRNSPAGRQYAAATAIVDEKPDGTSREMMLMYGGESSPIESTTWIYDLHSNSWEAIDQEDGPPAIAKHTLVTLCRKRVLTFGGFPLSDSSRNGKCSNETWMFDMMQKRWSLVNVSIHASNNDGYVTPRCQHAATAVYHENSSCSCKEAMLVYSGFANYDQTWGSSRNDLNDLWLLSCKNDVDQEYEWIRFIEKPPRLHYPKLVSVYNKTMVCLFGATVLAKISRRMWELWSLNFIVNYNVWRKRNNGTDLSMSVPGRGVYLTTGQSHHFLILCCSSPLLVFDLKREKWLHHGQSSGYEIPRFQEKSVTITKVGETILAFGRLMFVIGASDNWMWWLDIPPNGSWHWSLQKTRSINPFNGRLLTLSGLMTRQNEIILFGGAVLGLDVGKSYADNQLHRLNLNTGQWSVEVQPEPEFAFTATRIVLSQSIMVVYGGIGPMRKDFISYLNSFSPRRKTWGYYNDARMWIQYTTKHAEPPGRIFHSAAATSYNTMVIYGGYVVENMLGELKMRCFYDLWMFTVSPMNTNALNISAQTSDSHWRLISSSGANNTSYMASLVTVDNTLYLYGGSETIIPIEKFFKEKHSVVSLLSSCSNNLWTYNLSCGIECTWTNVSYGNVGPGRRCFHEAFVFGKHMLVTGGCFDHFELKLNLETLLPQYECPIDVDTSGVWLYKPSTSTWFRLTSQSIYNSAIIGTSSLLWNDMLLSFGGIPHEFLAVGQQPGDWPGFFFYRPACPAGTTTNDLRTYLCTDCPLSHYAASSNSTCSKCPNKLTTPFTGSTSRSNCSQCSPNYCHYGTCTVALQGPAPSCTCQFGFTKDNEGLCTVPAYYIAAIGFLIGILLIVLVVVLIAKSRKVNKQHNSELRIRDSEISWRQRIVTHQSNEIAQLNNTWTIDSREVKLRRRIDKDFPGVYGEVYEAEYREIVVAVKKLQGEHLQINRIFLEFEREIEVMKTIRHPNIVLFLGAGRHHHDDCPFLVVEYMPRGSLTKILSNQEIVLDDYVKLRFAIDAAKGMRFLHSRCPPRIHRDLKSVNLLVSQQWVVKVADFGTARLVRDEGINQQAVRGAGFLDLTAPLLHAEYHLSSAVGTPLWCAPEIWRGNGYGTPADVYR